MRNNKSKKIRKKAFCECLGMISDLSRMMTYLDDGYYFHASESYVDLKEGFDRLKKVMDEQ